MAETITHTWQTVEQAAVTLNVSTRTIARRLAGGGLESRVDENGRRLVLVQQINPAAVADETADYGIDDGALAVADAVAPQPLVASSQATAMLTVLQSTVNAARDDADRARRGAKWAWAGVGLMAALVGGGAALVSGVITKGVVTTDFLRGQLAETKSELKQTQAELMATRTAEAIASRDLSDAKKAGDRQRRDAAAEVAAAHADAASARQSTSVASAASPRTTAATPATQPTLLGKVVSLLSE